MSDEKKDEKQDRPPPNEPEKQKPAKQEDDGFIPSGSGVWKHDRPPNVKL
jgi:hypothetical protein